MKHLWGAPTDPITGGPDDSYARTVPKSCFIGAHYCINCEHIFCEHCLGPEMYNMNNCEGIKDNSV